MGLGLKKKKRNKKANIQYRVSKGLLVGKTKLEKMGYLLISANPS